MDLSFLKESIEKRWQNSDIQDISAYWDKVIDGLTEKELHQLIGFCLECLRINIRKSKLNDIVQAIKNTDNFLITSKLIDIDQNFNRNVIHDILEGIVISEYHMDSVLLLPPDMRSERLNEIAKAINIETNLIIEIDKYWRGKGLRESYEQSY